MPRPQGEPLSTYRYRAVVNGDVVTIRPRATTLILGGPAGHLFGKAERAGVAVADIALSDLGGEFESMVTMRTQAPEDAAERRLIEWAAEVGHRRIWIRDEVLDLADQLHIAMAVTTTCPCCLACWQEESWDFWGEVRRLGYFPCMCPICGACMPQWRALESTGASEERSWEDALASVTPDERAQGDWR